MISQKSHTKRGPASASLSRGPMAAAATAHPSVYNSLPIGSSVNFFPARATPPMLQESAPVASFHTVPPPAPLSAVDLVVNDYLCMACEKNPCQPQKALCSRCFRLTQFKALASNTLCMACGKNPRIQDKAVCSDCLALADLHL